MKKFWRIWYLASGGTDGKFWSVKEEGTDDPPRSFDQVILKATDAFTLRDEDRSRGYLFAYGDLGVVEQPGVGLVAIIGSQE